MNIIIYKKNYDRNDISNQPDIIFLFGDNTYDRTISKYIPTMTQAVIRGLPNAIGIDTKKNRYTTDSSYISDNDYAWFTKHVDEQINLAIAMNKTIAIPQGGIGTGRAKLQEKAPKCYLYLRTKLNELLNSSNQI